MVFATGWGRNTLDRWGDHPSRFRYPGRRTSRDLRVGPLGSSAIRAEVRRFSYFCAAVLAIPHGDILFSTGAQRTLAARHDGELEYGSHGRCGYPPGEHRVAAVRQRVESCHGRTALGLPRDELTARIAGPLARALRVYVYVQLFTRSLLGVNKSVITIYACGYRQEGALN